MLPVHENVQYTQHLVLPDYTGIWIGTILAAIGALILIVGVVMAFKGRRAG